MSRSIKKISLINDDEKSVENLVQPAPKRIALLKGSILYKLNAVAYNKSI